MNCSKNYFSKAFLITILMFFIVMTTIFSGCSLNQNQGSLKETKKFEGGASYRTSENAYWVLSLSGNWREMGRQYGGLVSDDLCQFYNDISSEITARGMDYNTQLQEAKNLSSSLSPDINELLKGMAETSGLSEDEVLILNNSFALLPYLSMKGETSSSCSALAAWDKYTPNGELVIGRNWDMDKASLEKYMKYLSVVVFNPTSGNSFANVHPLGNVYLETGINNKGVFVELNNGAFSDSQQVSDRECSASVLVKALNQYNTLDEVSKYLTDVPAELSYIIQVADSKECVSVERATFGARVRRTDQNGVLAAYNSFVQPYPDEWKGKVIDPPSTEKDPRYVNLINLANSDGFYGKLNIDGMKKLLDVQMQNGGAVHKDTVYQVIATPKELTLYVRAIDYSGWQQVNLKDLFNK